MSIYLILLEPNLIEALVSKVVARAKASFFEKKGASVLGLSLWYGLGGMVFFIWSAQVIATTNQRTFIAMCHIR